MSVRATVAAGIAAVSIFLFLFGAARDVGAADQQKVEEQIQGYNKAAMAAYEAGNFAKMKGQLAKAAALAETNGVQAPVVAQTYMLMGVLQVDAMDDVKAGGRSFARALKIQPDVQIPSGVGAAPGKKAFKEARRGSSVGV